MMIVMMVVMLNILKYRDPSEYAIYAQGVVKIVESLGGSVIWGGEFDQVVIGYEALLGGKHHTVALVRYPSRRAFLHMQTLPDFQRLARHRLKGLESQWLIACRDGMASKL